MAIHTKAVKYETDKQGCPISEKNCRNIHYIMILFCENPTSVFVKTPQLCSSKGRKMFCSLLNRMIFKERISAVENKPTLVYIFVLSGINNIIMTLKSMLGISLKIRQENFSLAVIINVKINILDYNMVTQKSMEHFNVKYCYYNQMIS